MNRKSPAENQLSFSKRHYLERPRRPPLIHEHWLRDSDGNVIRYGLAYINHSLHPGDNGRVLGYDNAHGFHERHFKGQSEVIAFDSYENVAERFLNEVRLLRGDADAHIKKS